MMNVTARQSDHGGNQRYVRVIQVDGQLAWSSPIWVTVDEAL